MPECGEQRATACCGGTVSVPPGAVRTAGHLETPAGKVPVAGTDFTWADRIGGWKVRWGIGRGRYSVPPGLYAVGSPDGRSPVLVTANYKLSFDLLRRELSGVSAWILVLDTRGINVWCAAGKGTFGAEEIVRRVEQSRLREVVSHRTLVLPQLGAPGVAAHEVKQRAGFRVVYGPVRAKDVARFLENGMKADPGMRVVTFTLGERMAVAPVELVSALKYYLLILAVLLAGNALGGDFSLGRALAACLPSLGAVLAGAVAVPMLLPWIPFRSFALKGWVLGVPWAAAISRILGAGPAVWAGNLLLLPAITSYLALNFTGSTTFTSQTGVNREIRLFARPMAASGILGVLVLLGRLVA